MAQNIRDLYHYSGSHTFDWISDAIGIPVDQVNFVLSQFTALFLAGILRTFLRPDNVKPMVRHSFGLVGGLLLGYFCFGYQAVHLALLPALCYIVIRTQDPRFMQSIVLVLALGYLSCVHVYRQIYTYGSYNLDITGPLMVITQKVTSMAYSIHDGVTRLEKDLTPSQKHHVIQIMPTTLEYFSYIFHFQTIMVGPIIFYRDYMDFVHGNNLKGGALPRPYDDSSTNQVNVIEPSPIKAVIKKVVTSVSCAVLFVAFLPSYPLERVKDKDFIENTGFLYKFMYLMISTMFVRFKYYYAWLFADAICNNAGMGFNGVDENGNEKWDLISNVNPLGFELSLSLKDSIESWNKGTNRWLRMIVYERVSKKNRVILTYTLSAIWHGFYPGYYLTFACGALLTIASRSVRRKIRPLFVGTSKHSIIYDALTFITTRIYMAYMTFSFVLLEFMPCIQIYTSMYLIPHVLAIVAVFLLPLLPISPPQIKQNGNVNNTLNKQVLCDITAHNNAEIRNGSAKKIM